MTTTTPHSLGQAPPGVDAEPGVAVQAHAGSLQITLEPARVRPIVPTLTAIGLMAVAVTLAAGPTGVTRILFLIPAMFAGLCGLIFAYIALYLWLVRSTVTARPSELSIRRSIVGVGFTRRLAVGDIASIEPGRSGYAEHRTRRGSWRVEYFGVKLTKIDGRTIWLASDLSQFEYAEWLAAQIDRALDRA